MFDNMNIIMKVKILSLNCSRKTPPLTNKKVGDNCVSLQGYLQGQATALTLHNGM